MVFYLYVKDIFVQLSRSGRFGTCAGESRYAHCLASFTKTTPFLGPGMLPLMPSTPRSASTKATLRLRVVTCSWPIWPAIFLPLNIFCGYIEPIEPGRR